MASESSRIFWGLIKEHLKAGATTQQAIQAAKEEMENKQRSR
jgi:hypothetical protein